MGKQVAVSLAMFASVFISELLTEFEVFMIVGVAIKIGDHIEIRLPRPNRHCDCFRHFQKATGIRATSLGLKTGGTNQGFYTDKGVYLDRVQAWRHVKRCGQELLPDQAEGAVLQRGPLFSEDVW